MRCLNVLEILKVDHTDASHRKDYFNNKVNCYVVMTYKQNVTEYIYQTLNT